MRSPSRSIQFPTNFVGKHKTQFRILLRNADAPSGCKNHRTPTSLPALNEESTSLSVSRACTDEIDQEPVLNNEKDWVHFVGIGGSGLSALAMLALKQVKKRPMRVKH